MTLTHLVSLKIKSTSVYLEGLSVEAVPRDMNCQIFSLKFDVVTHAQ